MKTAFRLSPTPVLISLLTLGMALSACDGSGDLASTAEADISGTGTDGSSGNIDAFGSIFVNGVRYDTSGASVYIDGVLAEEADLQLGQVVAVTTASAIDNSNASAESVRYTPLLEGEITAIDEDNESLTIMGQDALFGDITVSTDIDFDDLQVALGDYVEISGYYNRDGDIITTFAQTIASQTQQEIVGPIGSIEDNEAVFTIGDLTVDTRSANSIPATWAPNIGEYVDITGTLSNNTLIAETLVPITNNGFDSIEAIEVSIEGYVSHNSGNQFNLGAVLVEVNDSTVYDNGGAEQIATANEALVTGTLEANVLTASAVSFTREVELEIAGPIEAVDLENRSVTIFGITVQVPLDTLLQDEENNIRTFNLDTINLGDFIEVEIEEVVGEDFIALILKREPPEELYEISGPIANLNREARTFTIFDITLDASGQDIIMDTDDPVTLDEFFTNVQNGDNVEFKGDFVGEIFVVALIEP